MNRIIITAAIAATLVFSSCSTDDGEPVEKKSSSSRGGSSSSGGNSSIGGGNSSIGDGDSSSSGGENPSSSSRGGSNSSGGTTETYVLLNNDIDGEYFTYLIPDYYESCEAGTYKTEPGEVDQYYSIDDKTMTWSLWSDTLLFKGTSDDLIGTWTRKKSVCELDEDYDYDMYCKEGYDITKAVLTETTVAITRDVCPTDYEIDGSSFVEGWQLKVKDCNTLEISKGSDKITVIQSNDGGEKTTYNGNSCSLELTKAKKQAACVKAWNEWMDDDYEWVLENDYAVCLKGILPKEFFEGDDEICTEEDGEFCEEGSLGKISAKLAAKAKASKAKPKTKPAFPLKKKK